MIRALLLLLLSACSMDVAHEVELVGVGLPCETAFPACDGRDYTCEDRDGVRIYGCEVGCLAGRALECRADGPHCVNLIGDGDVIDVPIACFRTE